MSKDPWQAVRVHQQSVSESLAAHIEAKIASGDLKPGSRLPSERALAEAVGISRASVRDAIHELVLRGLVDRRSGKGSVVIERSAESSLVIDLANTEQRDLANTVDLRRAIEPEIAARAAERKKRTSITKLSSLLDQQEELLRREEQPGDNKRSAQLDRDFHLALAEATANPLFVSVVEQLNEQIESMRSRSHLTPTGRHDSLTGHQQIYSAIRDGNATLARAAMQHHVSTIASHVRHDKVDSLELIGQATQPEPTDPVTTRL